MSAATLETVLNAVEILDATDKSELASILLAHIHVMPNEIEDAWIAELERRTQDADSGKAQYLPWADVKAKFDKFFEANRT